MDFGNFREGIEEFAIGKSLANRYILEALKDFCEYTFLYSEWLTFLTTAGICDYTLSPTSSKTKIIGFFEDSLEFSTVDTPNPTAADSTTVGTLTAATTYNYKVTAISNDYGETLPCTAVSHVCPASGSIGLSWTAVDDADGYRVYRDSSGTYGLVEEITTNSYTDDGDETPDTTNTPPTKSNLVRQIKSTNKNTEKHEDRYWKTQESDWVTKILWDGNVTVSLDVIPETTNMGFQMEVALTFLEEPTAIPTIIEPHKETILDYVRGKIYLHPKTDKANWHDPQMGAFYMGEYKRKAGLVKMNVNRRFGGTLKVAPRCFV